MIFNLANLLEEPVGSSLRFHVDEGRLRLDEDLVVDFLRGDIKFIRVKEGIYAEGYFHTQVQLECARCLEPFSQPIEFRLEETFRPPSEKNPASPLRKDGTLNLTQTLREYTLLAMPMRPLCRPDCRGLCSQCGHNLNQGPCECLQEVIDPRLAMLKQLL